MNPRISLDGLLEFAVVPSFTRVGPAVRRRLFGWTDLDSYDLSGRSVAITGATSGLGLAAANQLVALGAHVIMISRNHEKALDVAGRITTKPGRISHVTADMGDLGQVRAAADELQASYERLDVLVLNAGALLNDRRTTDDGAELTVRVHVVSPFLLTGLLLDRLGNEDAPGRVLTMASGGMYAAGLTIDRLEMAPADYKGAEQYARAKRAQVTLNEMWAARTDVDVRFHALHPGWADTPGIDDALPGFGKLMAPLLRTPGEGADTLVWLAADDDRPLTANGGFWHDRQIRPIHRFERTRRTDTPDRRRQLWEWVSDRAGLNLD